MRAAKEGASPASPQKRATPRDSPPGDLLLPRPKLSAFFSPTTARFGGPPKRGADNSCAVGPAPYAGWHARPRISRAGDPAPGLRVRGVPGAAGVHRPAGDRG